LAAAAGAGEDGEREVGDEDGGDDRCRASTHSVLPTRESPMTTIFERDGHGCIV
jgi:hypothetical protein